MGRKKKKLHIGCGGIYKKGYINIDAYNLSKADLKAYADKLPFKDGSVDKIENYHLLEHLDRRECSLVLKEWFRVLKPGGKLLIEVPDLVENMKIFLRSSYNERWKNYRKEFKYGRVQTIYGLGEEKGQLHKNGFDKERLKILLKQYGFVKIEVSSKKGTPKKGENIVAACEKSRKTTDYKKSTCSSSQFLQTKGDVKNLLSRNLLRNYLRKAKTWIVYILRYLADLIEEVRFPSI